MAVEFKFSLGLVSSAAVAWVIAQREIKGDQFATADEFDAIVSDVWGWYDLLKPFLIAMFGEYEWLHVDHAKQVLSVGVR